MREIDEHLVRNLLQEQMPHWADLPLTAVTPQGNDNRTFRLGDDLSVRLPSQAGYAAGITKEDAALPVLADCVSTSLPRVVATGHPSPAFPFPFSVRRWLPGTALSEVSRARVDDAKLAEDLGVFLTELRAAPARGGPAAGQHSFFRGCHPSAYGHEVQEALGRLDGVVDASACSSIWARAVVSAWPHPPVWFHGDVAAGNLLVGGDGVLAAVIDFGVCGVGDPACDLAIAWTHFDEGSRRCFKEAVGLDEATWARARGWALWKVLVTIVDPTSSHGALQRRAMEQLLADA